MKESSQKRAEEWETPISKPAQPALRVLLDARKLGHGGIGTYIENAITGLLELGGVTLTLLGDEAKFKSYPWSKEVAILNDNTPLYSLDEMVRLPKRIDFSRFDLFHTPHYTLPYRIPIPTVVTVHDCIHIKHPEKRYYPYIARRLIRSALKRASKVIAVSNATKEELLALSPSAAPKISVVSNSIDPEFLNQIKSSDYLQSRFRISGNYLLSVVSMLKPHKGIEDLISAFANLKSAGFDRILRNGEGKSFSDLKLVLVGKGTEDFAERCSALQAAGDAKGILILGTVSKDDLMHLYRGAVALVIPSLAEGFCLPALEAKALGVPVVARPVPAVCELLGAADVRCRDFSIAALESGILRMLERLTAESPPTPNDADRIRETYGRKTVATKLLTSYREAIEAWRS